MEEKSVRIFANLTYDKGFKIVLGTEGRSENLLKSLLSLLLDLTIVDLKFLQTEKLGLTERDGESFFDVYCKDGNGRRFLVEMQMWTQHHFNKRAVYYSSLAVQDQARDAKRVQKNEGKLVWDYDFEPVYVISFLNFKNQISENPRDDRANPYVSHYVYMSKATHKELEDETNLIFVDLNRFKKGYSDCWSSLDKWLFSIKNMHNLLERPDGFDGEELEELYVESSLAAWNPDERTQYELYMANRNDMLNSIREQLEDARAEAIREGLKEGQIKGLMEGRMEGRMEGETAGRQEAYRQVALKMLSKGISVGDIADVTGLSCDEISCLSPNR